MHIVLLIDALGVGGAETHLVTLAAALAARHRVTVISSGGALEKALPPNIRILHFPAPLTSASYSLLLPRHVALVRRLCRQEKVDILHAHTRRTALLARLCRGYVGATVVTVHAKFRPLPCPLCFFGDATVAVSDDLAHHTAAFSLPPECITVIPNGIDTALFCPPPVRPGGRCALLFVSRLDRDCAAAARALLSLAPAWQARARERGLDFSLTLLGGGSALPSLRVVAAALPPATAACVHLPGAVERPASWMQAADLFVGVSRAALEAAATGCSVILAGDEGAGGLLTDRNFDRFAAENFCCRASGPPDDSAMQTLLDRAFSDYLRTDPVRLAATAALVRHRIQTNHSAARMAADTAALYERTLKQKR